MEKCYEYFDCTKKQCIVRSQSLPCWEIESNVCDVHADYIKIIQKEKGSKLDACKLCLYYKQQNPV